MHHILQFIQQKHLNVESFLLWLRRDDRLLWYFFVVHRQEPLMMVHNSVPRCCFWQTIIIFSPLLWPYTFFLFCLCIHTYFIFHSNSIESDFWLVVHATFGTYGWRRHNWALPSDFVNFSLYASIGWRRQAQLLLLWFPSAFTFIEKWSFL